MDLESEMLRAKFQDRRANSSEDKKNVLNVFAWRLPWSCGPGYCISPGCFTRDSDLISRVGLDVLENNRYTYVYCPGSETMGLEVLFKHKTFVIICCKLIHEMTSTNFLALLAFFTKKTDKITECFSHFRH